ncbi:MAG: cob(I)yrinic acid a,c-diamide adenosyltransferase [Oscillospiraceae bacterium]|nr:cob(I)yrinic acid a,c-diamide adenosyltransferase [Oscillospiraceae bacterium]
MIHFYYGNGKGKTSAAVGACLRAAGSGLRCVMVQFLKNGSSSEIALLKKCGIDTLACHSVPLRFWSRMNEQERGSVTCSHNENLQHIIQENYQFIVLDEMGDAIEKEAVHPDLVREILQLPNTEIIITGHKKTEQLIRCADYITEFNCIAHPFQKGEKARKGIEF